MSGPPPMSGTKSRMASVWQNLSKNLELAFLHWVEKILKQFIIGVKFFQVDSQTSIFNVWLLLIRWAGSTCLYCGLYNSTASLLLSSPLPALLLLLGERELSWLPPLISPAAPLFLPSNGILYPGSSNSNSSSSGACAEYAGLCLPSEI